MYAYALLYIHIHTQTHVHTYTYTMHARIALHTLLHIYTLHCFTYIHISFISLFFQYDYVTIIICFSCLNMYMCVRVCIYVPYTSQFVLCVILMRIFFASFYILSDVPPSFVNNSYSFHSK